MAVSSRLVTASRVMAALSLIGAVFLPLFAILIFLFPEQMRALNMHMGHLGADLTGAIPLQNRLFALACELIPTLIASLGLVALTRLFRLFADGNVFSLGTMRALSNVAMALFANVVSAFILQAPISYFLTRANPPGHRFISLGLGSDDVEVLFLACVALVISLVMAEAGRIADEHAKFV